MTLPFKTRKRDLDNFYSLLPIFHKLLTRHGYKAATHKAKALVMLEPQTKAGAFSQLESKAEA